MRAWPAGTAARWRRAAAKPGETINPTKIAARTKVLAQRRFGKRYLGFNLASPSESNVPEGSKNQIAAPGARKNDELHSFTEV
jgi:hypothetical protein